MKTAKKISIFILAILLLFAFGCKDDKRTGSDDDNGQTVSSENLSESSISSNESSYEPENGTNKENIKTYIDQDLASFDYNFSDGLCFAQIKFDAKKVAVKSTVCIDKNGDIQFELEGNYLTACNFSNGIALLQSNDRTYYICNAKGELTSLQDLDGDKMYGSYTSFEDDISSKMWQDGYFLVEKVTSDYSGTKHEVAIYNSKLEKVKDYSEELYTWFEKGKEKYFRDFILKDNAENTIEVLDVKSGALSEHTPESFYSTVQINKRSDLWSVSGYNVLTRSTLEVVCNLKEKYPTVHQCGDFENGFAPIIFTTEGSHYFSVLNEDFELEFAPVYCSEIYNSFIKRDAEYYCVFGSDKNNKSTIFIFNDEGLVSQHKFETYVWPTFNDGIIKLTSTEFYNMQFEKLF